MLSPAESYDSLYDGFRWELASALNMAVAVCDHWAAVDPDRLAILDLSVGRVETSYSQLQRMADTLAFELRAQGVARGGRVGVPGIGQRPQRGVMPVRLYDLDPLTVAHPVPARDDEWQVDRVAGQSCQ